jgi:APA family basic amino acid/polyamine antiporter
VGFLGAHVIMIGITIGSGIFRTPTSIAAESRSPAFILILWCIGGIVSLFGAITYAELAAMYPRSGGIYVFLREGYGRWLSFVFGWTYMLLSKPLAAAGIATVLVEHLGVLMGTPMTMHAGDAIVVNPTGQAVTCAILIALTLLNVRGMSLGAWITTGFTAAKVLALAAIVLVALALRRGDAANFTPAPSEHAWWLALAPILGSIMWTYDGWSDIGSVAGEVKDPGRVLPRAYILGTALIVLLYLLVNAVYIWIVPLPEMARLTTVGPAVMERLIGPSGATLAGVLIVIATFGATQGSTITGARVTYAQARDDLMFRWLARVHPKYQTPSASLWFQCVLSCVAVVGFHRFESFANGFVFTIWIFYGLAGGSIFIFRVKRPDDPRPFRCLGYPVVPAVFVLAAAAMTALAIIHDWRTTAVWIGVLLAGVPVYFAWESWGLARSMR